MWCSCLYLYASISPEYPAPMQTTRNFRGVKTGSSSTGTQLGGSSTYAPMSTRDVHPRERQTERKKKKIKKRKRNRSSGWLLAPAQYCQVILPSLWIPYEASNILLFISMHNSAAGHARIHAITSAKPFSIVGLSDNILPLCCYGVEKQRTHPEFVVHYSLELREEARKQPQKYNSNWR